MPNSSSRYDDWGQRPHRPGRQPLRHRLYQSLRRLLGLKPPSLNVDGMLIASPVSGDVTITLPAAAPSPGSIYHIHNHFASRGDQQMLRPGERLVQDFGPGMQYEGPLTPIPPTEASNRHAALAARYASSYGTDRPPAELPAAEDLMRMTAAELNALPLELYHHYMEARNRLRMQGASYQLISVDLVNDRPAQPFNVNESSDRPETNPSDFNTAIPIMPLSVVTPGTWRVADIEDIQARNERILRGIDELSPDYIQLLNERASLDAMERLQALRDAARDPDANYPRQDVPAADFMLDTPANRALLEQREASFRAAQLASGNMGSIIERPDGVRVPVADPGVNASMGWSVNEYGAMVHNPAGEIATGNFMEGQAMTIDGVPVTPADRVYVNMPRADDQSIVRGFRSGGIVGHVHQGPALTPIVPAGALVSTDRLREAMNESGQIYYAAPRGETIGIFGAQPNANGRSYVLNSQQMALYAEMLSQMQMGAIELEQRPNGNISISCKVSFPNGPAKSKFDLLAGEQ